MVTISNAEFLHLALAKSVDSKNDNGIERIKSEYIGHDLLLNNFEHKNVDK